MTKRINRLEDWISAHDAAILLSDKMKRPIPAKYIRSLAKRKKNPVHTQSIGYHKLYNRSDILAVTIKQKQ